MVWINCGLLWCFYQLFGLSFWRHPFTAEHPLLRHWCSDTFLQTWWRNKLVYISDGLRMRMFSANGWTIPLNSSHSESWALNRWTRVTGESNSEVVLSVLRFMQQLRSSTNSIITCIHSDKHTFALIVASEVLWRHLLFERGTND